MTDQLLAIGYLAKPFGNDIPEHVALSFLHILYKLLTDNWLTWLAYQRTPYTGIYIEVGRRLGVSSFTGTFHWRCLSHGWLSNVWLSIVRVQYNPFVREHKTHVVISYRQSGAVSIARNDFDI